MSTSRLRILFLEDRETDVLLMRHALQSAGLEFDFAVYQTEPDLRTALSQAKWDVVLSDYSMPEMSGQDALQIVRSFDPDLPFILVSGSVGDEVAVAMLKDGAQNYVLKEKLVRLPVTIERELREAEERRARKAAEAALKKSEERVRLAASAGRLGIWSYDVRSNVVHWNDECYETAGVPRGTVITGELLESLIHPEDRERRRQVLGRAMREGLEARMEYRLVRPDGELRWISSHGKAQFDNDGSVKEVVGVALDITSQKLADQSLRKSEERFRGLSASSPVGIFEADLDGNVLYTNLRISEIWQMSPAELAIRGWLERVHPEDRDRLVARWTEANAKGLQFESEYRLLLPDGEVRWIYGRSSVVRDAEGRASGTIGTVDDITDRKKAEETLMQSERLAAVGRMSSMIAHEINNPLEAVTNLIYLAETSQDLNQETRDYLRDAQSELQRVAQITTQTLQFQRQSKDRKWVQAGDLVESSLGLFARRLKEQRIALDLRVGDLPLLFCQPDEIRQVLVNLIGNALDAMHGHPGRLIIAARCVSPFGDHRKSVRFTVADSGSGMPAAVKDRIFDAFFTTKGERGSGLGMWVSGEIISRHGGRIQIRSSQTAGRSGTVMSFSLPVAERAQ